ncbi:hypothetical protein ABI59_10540 [Acidobacteria bacterium Mor1]|nr:hypothetical protein ABI59_10540 [Acidobacteria bacterium Mor1]
MSSIQLDRLAEIFVTETPVGLGFDVTLDFLAGREDARVDRVALAVIESGMRREWGGWSLRSKVPRVLARFDDPRLEERMRVFPELSDASMESVRLMWATAKWELGLPEVPPLELLSP